MQEIINQILEGNFDYEGGSLDFSCAKLELTFPKGSLYEGSFRILSPTGCFTTGYVTTSDLRMECLTPEFTGIDEEISFCFHGENMEEGDVVKGAFYVISNQGEYYLPFVVSVEHTVLNSSIGTVKNLFHFANLAKSNWQEAVNLFYSPEFLQIFTGSDSQYLDAYRGLAAYAGHEQNVEEFLIHVNKKQKTEYITEEHLISMEFPDTAHAYSVSEKELTIVRNGWGYTRLTVECQGDFLFTEKEILTDDDFLGNHCRLPVFIDASLCRNGKNFGQIYLYNSYVSLTVPVVVRVGEGLAANHADLTTKRTIVHMMDFYQAFRMKKIGTTTWLKETRKLVELLVALDEKNVAARLFQAQMLLTEERYNEANWLLEHGAELMRSGERDDTLWAYYLYLTTLMNRDAEYVDEVAAQVKEIYRHDVSNWRVAWLLLYLSEEYNRSASRKWVFLERQFEYGCTSPILYIEVLALLNNNPALLRRIGSFELQVLWFGAKQQALSGEVVEQLLYLSGRVREFSPVLLKILKSLYRTKPDVRVLQEICVLLIKGGKAGTEYFTWYKAGVEAQLRITNLYEYFMMSLDLNTMQPLPKMVLMYFSYQNNLDYEHSAYLYDYVLQNRSGFEELYQTYCGRMEHFVIDQIQKGHINRHLANLYRELLTSGMVNQQTAIPLSRLLFAHQVQVENPGLCKIYVYQPGNLIPQQYVITEGRTWIALYGNEYTIVFEDSWGNRFTKNVEYTLEKLMFPGRYLGMVVPYVRDCLELDLYLDEKEREDQASPEERIARQLRIAESKAAASFVKREIYLKILRHYFDTDNMRALDEYLEYIPPQDLSMSERGTVLKYMVLRGIYPLAYEWIVRYGPYFADAKILMRLISPIMERNNMVEDPVLTAAAVYSFQKGKYDGTILTYLTLYYRGMTKNMRDIWKAAKSYEADCYRLSEKMLVQMLYSGAFVGEKMEIFRYYVSQGAKPEVEEAFLSQCAYDYFVNEKVTEDEVFQEIKNMYLRSESVQKVCKLAYLKFYSENKKETGDETLIKAFLQEMAEERIHLDFMRTYQECPQLQQDMMDKTIIEYHANPKGKACIHYVILHENGEADEYRSEYMRDVYGGICFKEFVLFFGESLQYYITEEKNGEEQLTESGILQKSEINNEPDDSKFRLINDIMISKTLQDYDTLDSLLEEYYRKEYYNSRLFVLT